MVNHVKEKVEIKGTLRQKEGLVGKIANIAVPHSLYTLKSKP